jgi:hypothetical protein
MEHIDRRFFPIYYKLYIKCQNDEYSTFWSGDKNFVRPFKNTNNILNRAHRGHTFGTNKMSPLQAHYSSCSASSL